MFAGCAIGCCSLRQVRENALVSGKFFTLLQIARRELYLANHGHVKTRQCTKILKENYLASLLYIIFGN